MISSTADKRKSYLPSANSLPPGLQYLFVRTIRSDIAGQPIAPFTELYRGHRSATRRGQIVQEALDETKPDDLATILYTSGTTGEAKGVMLSHGNLASNAHGDVATRLKLTTDDVRLSWLPLSHIFARTCDLYTWLVRGCAAGVGRQSRANYRRLPACCIQPLMNGVPYFFEKVMPIAYRGQKNRSGRAGRTDASAKAAGRADASLLLRRRGACPITWREFFWREGVPLVQGYGLTESSPVITTCTPDRTTNLARSGQPIEGVEVKIADDGEILTRGPHVMLGYWNRPADTAETIRDGWLHTGDLGELDSDGFLQITGRKKELIVTAGGKNIAPAFLEGCWPKSR